MSAETTQPREVWSSRLVFILATSGSAIGLGNIWRFPYMAGENGGGAFILVYLACVLLIGIPILLAEVMLGRCGGANPVHSLAKLAKRFDLTHYWRFIGWVGIIGGFTVLSYYSVIAGWTMAYLFRSMAGVFNYVTADGAEGIFNTLISDSEKLIAWHTLFILMTATVIGHGIKKGIERIARWFIPSLLILLLFLLGYVIIESDVAGGLSFLFSFNTSQLTGEGVLIAMGHAFFSLGVGMGAVMAYGSYLPGHMSIFKAVSSVAALDTIVALIAGIIIFSLVSEFALNPAGGAGLVFKILPLAFGQINGGAALGAVFYFLLAVAAWTSAVSLLEPAVSWMTENFQVSRVRATVQLSLITWVLGLLTVFSFSNPEQLTIVGRTVFEWFDYITANYTLPLGGLLIIFLTAWKLPIEFVRSEIGIHSKSAVGVIVFSMRYIAPLGALAVFLYQVIS